MVNYYTQTDWLLSLWAVLSTDFYSDISSYDYMFQADQVLLYFNHILIPRRLQNENN